MTSVSDRLRTWYGPAGSNPITTSALVAALRFRTVRPEAKPGSAIRFHPAQRWIWEAPGDRPKSVIESAAVPFSQKPWPLGIANVDGSDGRADDHPKPPAHASYVHASIHARPAARSPNVGSVRSMGIPSKLSPTANARCIFTAREVELAALFAASIVSIR